MMVHPLTKAKLHSAEEALVVAEALVVVEALVVAEAVSVLLLQV